MGWEAIDSWGGARAMQENGPPWETEGAARVPASPSDLVPPLPSTRCSWGYAEGGLLRLLGPVLMEPQHVHQQAAAAAQRAQQEAAAAAAQQQQEEEQQQQQVEEIPDVFLGPEQQVQQQQEEEEGRAAAADADGPRAARGPMLPPPEVLQSLREGTYTAPEPVIQEEQEEEEEDWSWLGELAGPAPPPELLLQGLEPGAAAAEVARVLGVVAASQAAAAAAAGPAAAGPDPYAVLGVERSTPSAAVKRRYWKLSLLVHPDKNGGSQDAQLAFQAVKRAAEQLAGERRRPLPSLPPRCRVRLRVWVHLFPLPSWFLEALQQKQPKNSGMDCSSVCLGGREGRGGGGGVQQARTWPQMRANGPLWMRRSRTRSFGP